MITTKIRTFDEWLYEVCLSISIKSKQDITEVYSSIDMTDAKLCYIDSINPQEYINQ